MVMKYNNKREHNIRIFVEAYLVNGSNATQAAIKAGYSKNGARSKGHGLLNEPLTQRLLNEKRVEKYSEVKVDADYLKGQYQKLIETADVKTAKSAMDALGKMIGAFEIDNSQKQSSIQVQYYAPKKDEDK